MKTPYSDLNLSNETITPHSYIDNLTVLKCEFEAS